MPFTSNSESAACDRKHHRLCRRRRHGSCPSADGGARRHVAAAPGEIRYGSICRLGCGFGERASLEVYTNKETLLQLDTT